MASAAFHRAEAVANRAHGEELLDTSRGDRTKLKWAVTALFYSAVHALSAHLADHGIHVASHASRELVLADPSNGVPQDVYDAYMFLKQRSVGARYQGRIFTEPQVRFQMDDKLATILTFASVHP